MAFLGGLGVIFSRLGVRLGDLGAVLGGLGGVWGHFGPALNKVQTRLSPGGLVEFFI